MDVSLCNCSRCSCVRQRWGDRNTLWRLHDHRCIVTITWLELASLGGCGRWKYYGMLRYAKIAKYCSYICKWWPVAMDSPIGTTFAICMYIYSVTFIFITSLLIDSIIQLFIYNWDFCRLKWWKDNEWVNEWMSEWVSEWMNKWVSKWINEWMSKWMNEWMGEWMNKWMNCFLGNLSPM